MNYGEVECGHCIHVFFFDEMHPWLRGYLIPHVEYVENTEDLCRLPIQKNETDDQKGYKAYSESKKGREF